jgi:hypothetical protein
MKNRAAIKHNPSREKGAVVFEMILIIPFIIFICALSIEFTRALRYMKIAMSLSKEAANIAYRECADVKTLVTTPCLPLVQAKMTRFAQLNILPGSTTYVAISVAINYNGSQYQASAPSVWPANSAGSQCGPIASKAAALLASGGAAHEVVVCAHSYVPYHTIIPFLHRLLGFNFAVDHFSDDTII